MWRAKYRLPDGRQVRRTIGPVWSERGRPPEGHFTKRTAEAWLPDVLDQAERDARHVRTQSISAIRVAARRAPSVSTGP